MDPRALEQTILDAIVECLADRVVERLQAQPKVALALFTGTELGVSEAVKSIEAMRDDGWTMRFVFSQTAGQLRLRDSLTGVEVDASTGQSGETEGDIAEDALLDRCGVLLVPTLSINSAAKIATGVRDSIPSRLVARALERGITVVAASDGCCPDNPQRIASGFHVAEAYKEQLRANLEALQRYGIRLARAEKLAHAVRKMNVAAVPAVPAVSTIDAGGPLVAAGKRVFSRSDAVQCRARVLRLGRNVLVTSLAADELRVRNIQLIRN